MAKRGIIVTGIVLSIVYIVLEFITHGVFLSDAYQQTAALWRPEAEMQQMLWMMYIWQIIFAFMFAVIYAGGYNRSKSGFGQGFKFGFYMALMLAPAAGLMWYVVMPIPQELAVSWCVATAVQMWVLGIVAGIVYKPSQY